MQRIMSERPPWAEKLGDPSQGQKAWVGKRYAKGRRAGITVSSGTMKRAMAMRPRLDAPVGRADIAPSQFEQIEERRLSDHRRALDHPGVAAFRFQSRVESLEPAAGRGHLSLELRRAGLEVASFDLYPYARTRSFTRIGIGDIHQIGNARKESPGSSPICPIAISELATHLISLGVRDRCGVAAPGPYRVDRPKSAPQTGARAFSLRRCRDVDGEAALGGTSSRRRIAPAQHCLGSVGRGAAHRRPLAPVCRQAGAAADAARPGGGREMSS